MALITDNKQLLEAIFTFKRMQRIFQKVNLNTKKRYFQRTFEYASRSTLKLQWLYSLLHTHISLALFK